MSTRAGCVVGLVVALLGLSLAGAGAASVPRVVTDASRSGTWSSPMPLPGAHDPQSLSCPVATICVAADTAGNVFRFDGTRWSAPTALDPACAGQQGCGLIVSCPTSTFCAAIDQSGQTATYDGTWSTSARLQGSNPTVAFTALTCAAAKSCVAVDDDEHAFTYDGSWSPPVATDHAPDLLALSCPTIQFCAALGQSGDFVVERGGAWTTRPSMPLPSPQGGSEPNQPAALSCPTAAFCAALDSFGHASVYRAGRWSAPTTLDDNENGAASVSCPTTTFCVAVDEVGNIFRFDGRTWSRQTSRSLRNASLTSVSCPTTRSCVALDSANGYLLYTGR